MRFLKFKRRIRQSGLTDIYHLGFSSQPHLAVQIAPRFLFQAVRGQPTDLILNGCIESLGLVCVFKVRSRPRLQAEGRTPDEILCF